MHEYSAHEIRTQLEQAPFDEAIAEELLYKLRTMEDKEPLFVAFQASAEGIMCIHTDNMFAKMKYANNAVDISNEAVALDENHFEIRFIRFAIQSQMPKILGKRKNIKEDKQFIITHFTKEYISDIPFRNLEEMVHLLEQSKEFSSEEILEMKATLYSL